MLNPFPILFLSLLAYFVLRVVTGGILIYLGIAQIRPTRRRALQKGLGGNWLATLCIGILVFVEFVAGTLLILGLLTQFAALATLALSFIMLFFSKRLAGLVPDSLFYLLLFAVSLSLFITGAGAFAFDLPI